MSDVGLAELRGWPRGKEKLNPKGVEVGGLKNVKKAGLDEQYKYMFTCS